MLYVLYIVLSLMLIREHQSTAEVRETNNLKCYTPASASYENVFIIYSLSFVINYISSNLNSFLKNNANLYSSSTHNY